MKLAAEEFVDPLGPEFEETLDEINFGVSVAEALKNLAVPGGLPRPEVFRGPVILQRETGGNLAEIIEGLAHLMRERFRFRGKVRILTAEGRLTGKILVAIPILMFVAMYLLNPDYAGTLIHDPAGPDAGLWRHGPDGGGGPGDPAHSQTGCLIQEVAGMFLTDENIPLLIAALAFVVICLLSIGDHDPRARGALPARMLDKIRTEDGDWTTIGQEASGLDLSGGPATGLAGFLSAIGMRANRPNRPTRPRSSSSFCGPACAAPRAPPSSGASSVLLAVALPMAFLVRRLLFFKGLHSNHMLLGAAFPGPAGPAAARPVAALENQIEKGALTRAFPDALDLLVVCVEAGMGLDAAISRVGEELGLSHPELSEEFKRLNLELRAGKPGRPPCATWPAARTSTTSTAW
jgi:tight adherence protein C